MSKLIIECNNNGEAFELLAKIQYAIGEAKVQAFKDFLDAVERKDLEKANFYNNEFDKFKKLGRQIRNCAKVEL